MRSRRAIEHDSLARRRAGRQFVRAAHAHSSVATFLPKDKHMKIVCIIAALLAISVTTAGKISNRQLTRSIYKDLDVMCRGGYGNRPSTDEACAVRTKVSTLQRSQAEPAPGNAQANTDLALSIYKDLDAMCRGGVGDRPETQQACNVRTKVSALLRNMGYCWRGAWWKKCRS
jgi:hypothetical protein